MAISLDRQKILNSARQQFAKLGFKKASLTDIARPLGVKKTALYHHFPGGKRELMEAVITREGALILDHMRAAIVKESDPRQQLRAMLTSKLFHAQRLRDLLDVPRDVGEEVTMLYADGELSYNREELAMITGIIEYGISTGIFRSTDPGRLASVLQMVCHRIETTLVFEMIPEAIKQHIDDLLDILFHGIVATRGNIRLETCR